MNLIQHLIDRQLGTYNPLNCDDFLKRLVVGEWESFFGLQATHLSDGFDEPTPIFASRFSEAPGYEHVLALANEDGTVAIQDTSRTSTVNTIDRFQSHDNAVFDLAWMPGSKKFITVSGDHTACLWDVGESAPRRLQVFSNHSRSVKTAAFRPEEPSVFATGARDGNILLWDARAGNKKQLVVLQPEHSLVHCHAQRHGGGRRARLERRVVSITGLAFRDRDALLSCGECDGSVKLWDLRKSYSANARDPLPARRLPYAGSSTKNGFTDLLVDPSRTHLYASCMDGVIYRYCIAKEDARPERTYVGHESGTFYVKTSLSPDGAYLLSGSSDTYAYVWNVQRPEPVVRLVGHWAEVTCVAWCQKGETKIVTSGDDATHKIWRVGPEWPHPAPDWPRRKGCAEVMPRVDRQCGTPDRPDSDEPAPSPDRVFGVKRRLFGGQPPPSKRPKTDSAPREKISPTESSDSSKPVAVKVSPTKVRIVSFATPTSDLPDFVLTGEAPHLKSPLRKRKRDWLTQMGQQIPAKVPTKMTQKPPKTAKKRSAKQLPITLLIRKQTTGNAQ